MSKPVKIGLWGGNGGYPHDVKASPGRLLSVTIRHQHCIDAISFNYEGCDGAQYEEAWGGSGGKADTIDLQTDFVKEISGTIGKYGGWDHVVTSLTIVTFDGRIETYGKYNGVPFSIPVFDEGSRIVGFFGRSGTYLDAIGLYVVNP